MNDLSLMLPTQQTIAFSAYIDFIPHLQHSKPLGSSRFSKTVKCLSPSGSVVVKLLIKPTNHEIDLLTPLKRYEAIRLKLEGVANVLPFNEIIDSDRAAYLIRDYVRYNLLDRLSIRPFLDPIEKKWIIYQLLQALSKIHERDVYHGDIKSENILLTSWNWSMLTDFAHLKPVYLPDYNQSQFSFYFDTNHRHSCYVAPERFKSKDELDHLNFNDYDLKPEMDIFSLGCTIVELFTEGIPIFSLSQMFKYRKGEYTPNLDSIDDINIKKMIQSMISLNPEDRLSAKDYLLKFRKLIFPDHFYTFLHPYMKSIASDKTFTEGQSKNMDKFHLCNLRIDKVWSDFDKIALYLGFKGQIMKWDSEGTEHKDSIIPVELNLPGMKRHIPQNTSKIFTESSNNDRSSLIFLSMVMYNVRNTTHSAYRSKACDLILAFAEQLPDEVKFDRCLPYLANMLDDPNEELQSVALKSITQLVMMIDTITPINVYLFPEYLLPKLNMLLKRSYTEFSKESTMNTSKVFLDASTTTIGSEQAKFDVYSKGSYIRMVFACCLPYLAHSAKRFYKLSKLLKNDIGTFHDPDIDGNLSLGNSNSFEFDYNELETQFEQFARRILTDNDSLVKISLMKNIIPLCSFFSKDKINDVILSHLITYLNDRTSQLKLAFIESILPISIFVGPTSVEQYILPLLIQTLYDPDELIVIALLHTLKEFVDLGMIRKSCYLDLIELTIKLTLHPSEQIRESIINLVLSIGKRLSLSELYCMVYPLIRPYFQHEINDFTWENLYLTMHFPLSRKVYSFVKIWSTTESQTLFWQRVNLNESSGKRMDSFGNTKMTFMKKQRGANTLNKSTLLAATNDVVLNSEVPWNKEDKKQIEQLVAIGFNENDLWKIATMRSYIFKVVKLESRDTKYTYNWDNKLNLMARSVFVDVKYQFEDEINSENVSNNDSEVGGVPKLLSVNNISNQTSQPAVPLVDEAIISNGGSPVFLLPNLKQTKPFISENKAVAIGETSSIFSNISRHRRAGVMGNTGGAFFDDFGDANVFDETLKQKRLVTSVNHTYPGYNPFILKFLDSLQFKPDLDIFTEFGEVVKTLKVEPITGGDSPRENGKLICHLHEHIDSINCLAVSPDHRYFVTGDDGGFIKIWESARLELDVTGDSCLSANLGSSIKKIKFIPERNCFVVATSDNTIKIFRVDFVNSLNKPKSERFKETSITLIRNLKLRRNDEMIITELKVSILKDKPYILITTSNGKIIILDIRTMTEVKSLQNDVMHGIPLSICVDRSQNWLLVSTSRGVLDLWDIESEICVKSVKFKGSSFPVTSLEVLDNDSYELYGKRGHFVSFIGGTGQSDVIIWDVSRMIPRVILCSNGVELKSGGESYSVKDVDDEMESKMFDFWDDHNNVDKSCTSITLIENAKILSSSWDKRVIEWDLCDFSRSKCISGGPLMNYNETAVSSSLSIVSEKQNKEMGSVKLSKTLHFFAEDKVNSIGKLLYPFEMTITADRGGSIRIYR